MARGDATTLSPEQTAPMVPGLVCSFAVAAVGTWAVVNTVLYADTRALLGFGILAFALGLSGLKLRLGASESCEVKASVLAAMASIPFLGPAACVPAMLAGLGRQAAREAGNAHPLPLLIETLRLSSCGLAGGVAYAAIAHSPAATGTPIPAPAFGAGCLAYAFAEFTTGSLASPRTEEVRSAVPSYVATALAAALAALWLQGCPRAVVAISGVIAVILYGANQLALKRAAAQQDVIEEPAEPAPLQAPDVEAGRPLLVDSLTGLANDRYLFMFLQQEIGRSARKGQPVSLLLLDIDDFQSLDQERGSEAADRVLVRVAGLLKDLTREYDLAARVSSDEFAVALPETGLSDALDTAERIRKGVSQHDFGESTALRVSVGVASYPEHGLTPDNLLSSAHHALNRAKFSGKDQVVTCQEVLSKLKYGT